MGAGGLGFSFWGETPVVGDATLQLGDIEVLMGVALVLG